MNYAKHITLFAAAAVLWLSCGAATCRIESEKGENWWGLYLTGGQMQPFASPFRADVPGHAMLLSSTGRYVWFEQPAQLSFDGGTFSITTPEVGLAPVRGGRNLREAYLVCCHKNCPPDPAKVPDAALFSRPYYETALEFGFAHTAQSLLDYAARLLREGYPAGMMVISPGWSRGDGLFEFDPEYYPDPKGFIDSMHGMGFSVMLTVTPMVDAAGRGYVHAVAADMLVTDSEKRPVVRSGDYGYRACLDMGNPTILDSTRERLARLREVYGVDALRLECAGVGDYMPARHSREFLSCWTSLGDVMPGCQWAPAQGELHGERVMCLEQGTFGGWGSLEKSVASQLTASLAGYATCLGYWSSATQQAASDRALVARALLCSIPMPLCTVPFAPWRAGGDFAQAVLSAVKRRMAINGYIADLLSDAARTAEPLVRSMEYCFPRSGFADCDDQYMIGSRYLVVPVVSASGATVRLPRGVWIDGAGRRYKGPVVTAAPRGGEPLVYELVK